MMLLIGLIFLVVGVNIFHSMRRAVAEKTEDIAVLKAMGASPEDLGRVFVIDGLAIGAGGALVGLALGLLVAVNVNEVFAIVEALVNAVLVSRFADRRAALAAAISASSRRNISISWRCPCASSSPRLSSSRRRRSASAAAAAASPRAASPGSRRPRSSAMSEPLVECRRPREDLRERGRGAPCPR